jgi:hypothetical protein
VNLWRAIRLTIVLLLLIVALVWVSRTPVATDRVNLFITAVIGAVTTVYALFTFEILLQNQQMAKAALKSTSLMEQSLRFAHAANLLYGTITVKDPTFKSNGDQITPIENDDYKRAISESNSGNQAEFVFAVVKNKGQGSATNLTIEATYSIIDSSSINREATVAKHASVQVLEPKKSVALCIFISKIPTADDSVSLISAQVTAGDFYRDSVGDPPMRIETNPRNHHVDRAADCVIRLS